MRVQEQNEKPISVIIGNPPYNANAILWGDGRDNWPYTEVDRRIRETYVAQSTTQKTKQYDMYKRFIRWASDRLADDGAIAFVSNRAFIDSNQDDGFRKVIAEEFDELWMIDLKGNARTSGERRRREGGSIFDDKIRVGVAVYFLVRRRGGDGFRVFYNAVDDYAKAHHKIDYIRGRYIAGTKFEEIVPDTKHNWLKKGSPDFEGLLRLANRRTRSANTTGDERAMFRHCSMGVSTNRDGWVYDFDIRNLRDKALFFADTYNELLDKDDYSYPPIIKWSSTLFDVFNRRERLVYNDGNRLESLYRPFVTKHYFAETAMSDRLTTNHHQMFDEDLKQPNKVIYFQTTGARRPFAVLASDRLADLHLFIDGTQSLPLYRYTPEGERVSNITKWGIRRINDHYRKEWGEEHFQKTYPDGIDAEEIFAYTYAVLHDPVYRYDYRNDLLREFPRLPLYHEFDIWARMGRELLDLHVGFESAAPYPLKRVDKSPPARTSTIRESAAGAGYATAERAAVEREPLTPSPSTGEGWGEGGPRPRLRADKERGVIVLDEQTSLTGVPPDAWRYRLGNRSALEWVLDQYKEKKPRDPTIRERFDTYRFADHKEHVIDLLKRVCTVSVKTMDIVDGMAYWEDGYLVVYGDRDKHEWSMMGVEAMHSEPEDEEWLKQWLEM